MLNLWSHKFNIRLRTYLCFAYVRICMRDGGP